MMHNKGSRSLSSPPPQRGHYLAAAVFFTLLAVYASLMPFHLRDLGWATAVERFRSIPYFHLAIRHRADWVANILLYMPIGFFWLGWITVDRRHWWRTFFGGSALVVFGTVMAVAVEFTQVWFAPRTVSQNDILAEAIGTILGVLLWMLIGRQLTRWIRRFTQTAEPHHLLDLLIQVWVLGLIIYSLLPFDFIVDFSELVDKYHRGKIHLFPAATQVIDFRWSLNRVIDMLIFAPVGAFAAGIGRSRGAPRSSLRGIAIGSAIVSAVIVCQLFVYSQEVEGNDVLTHYLGVIVGVVGYRRWSLRPSRDTVTLPAAGLLETLLWLTAILGYGVVLGATFWSPFQFGRTPEQIAMRLHRFLSLPFVGYYHGSEFSAMKNIVSKTVLAMPLGMLWAIAIGRWSAHHMRRRLLFSVAILYCAALAVVIELGQAWLPPHVPDISDTLLYIAGALLGMKIVLLFRRRETAESGVVESVVAVIGERGPSRSDAVGAAVAGSIAAENGGPRSAHYAVLSLFFAVILVYGSLVPFHFRSVPLAEAAANFRSQPLFARPSGKNRLDWCVNFLLTVPLSMTALGALLAGRRRWPHLLWAVPVVLTGSIGLSLSVEFLQSWFPPRVPSLDDVVAQSAGALAGVGLWLIAGRTVDEAVRDFRRLRQPPDRIDWLLYAYVVGLLIHSVLPLNVIFSPEELLQKYRQGKIEFIPFSTPYESVWWMLYERGTDILVFVPIGMWAAIAWNPRGRSLRPLIPTVAVGLCVVAGIEVAQLLIMSRFSSTTDVILGCAGVLAGWQVMHLWRKETEPSLAENRTNYVLRWLAATGMYALFLMILFWTPFDFTRDVRLIKINLSGFWVIPFTRFVSGSALQGLAGILREILWFAPLGILLANVVLRMTLVGSLRRVLLAAGCVMIGGISLVIELGQVFLPGRVADVTGVLLATASGVAAMLITIRVLRADD